MPDEIDTITEQRWDAIQQSVTKRLGGGSKLSDYLVVEAENRTDPFRVTGIKWENKHHIGQATLSEAEPLTEGVYELSSRLAVPASDIPTIEPRTIGSFVDDTRDAHLRLILHQIGKNAQALTIPDSGGDDGLKDVTQELKDKFENSVESLIFLSNSKFMIDAAKSSNVFTKIARTNAVVVEVMAIVMKGSHGPRVQLVDDLTLSWRRHGADKIELVLRSWFYLDIPPDSVWKLVRQQP